MNSFMDEIRKFSDLGSALSLSHVLFSVLLTFLLSMVIAKTYQKTYTGATYSPAFMHTLVITGMVVAAVMMIIGTNIARAFSLVGALSIIRYRNAVKDPRDVAFIFLVMAIGMAAGTGFFTLAIALTAICCSVMLVLHWLDFGGRSASERLVTIVSPLVAGYETAFEDVLKSFGERVSLLSIGTTRMGTEAEMVYSVAVPQKFQFQKLQEALQKIHSNILVRVSGSSHLVDL